MKERKKEKNMQDYILSLIMTPKVDRFTTNKWFNAGLPSNIKKKKNKYFSLNCVHCQLHMILFTHYYICVARSLSSGRYAMNRELNREKQKRIV